MMNGEKLKRETGEGGRRQTSFAPIQIRKRQTMKGFNCLILLELFDVEIKRH